jgi:hypothetical protein
MIIKQLNEMFFCIHIFIYKDKADIVNNPYLMVRSRSEYYASMSVSGLPTFLIILYVNVNILLVGTLKLKYITEHRNKLTSTLSKIEQVSKIVCV